MQMKKTKNNPLQVHLCVGQVLPIDKYLQVGVGIGKHILAVGESPAANGWLKSGRAFFTVDGKIVPTGKNFLINLRQIDDDLDLEKISFTEIAKCFVANNRGKLMTCAAKTWPHFVQQIEYIDPKIIIILGKKTTEIFNTLAKAELQVGVLQKVDISGKKYVILPIYHPSPLNPRRVQNVEFISDNLSVIRNLLL